MVLAHQEVTALLYLSRLILMSTQLVVVAVAYSPAAAALVVPVADGKLSTGAVEVQVVAALQKPHHLVVAQVVLQITLVEVQAVLVVALAVVVGELLEELPQEHPEELAAKLSHLTGEPSRG